jgi:hypothetical protein
MEDEHSSNHVMGNSDHDVSFEDLVQNEHTQKEKTLFRISQAKRERSGSSVALEKIAERPTRSGKANTQQGWEDDEDDEEEPDMPDNDLRKALFEAIPEPYPHTLNYQRVIISDAGDPLDFDTKDSCARLKKCMEVRNKWIGAHPFPPQDENNFASEPSSPERPAGRKGKIENNYRRREPPTYEIFGVPLPHSIHHLRFKTIAGVVHVQNAPQFGNQATAGSPVGMTLTTDSADEVDRQERQQDGAEVAEDDGIDWSRSIYPVYSYKEYVQDYTYVSIRMFLN